ncbi:MAG: DUF1553 domain-containing protein [Verrucomicrobiota bacterium]
MSHRQACVSRLLIALASLSLVRASAAPSAEQLEFFEKRIRPVLVGECYECHAGKKSKGGLKLDDRAGLLKGGDSGPAIIPGNAKKSLLIQSMTHENPDLKMPDKGAKLDDAIIKDFIAWVILGAPDPRDRPPETAEAVSWDATLAVRKQWWSFQPVRPVPVPKPKDTRWSEHPVDRFLLAKMEERGLKPAAPADRRALLRRVTFALTGLPPTPAELEAFAADKSRDAFERVVDRLLASPAFGERWARHWLDLMRYAETHGSEGDPEIREAWRYRDYLIRAFNADVPCDQLIREHLAGDLLPNPRLNRAEGLNESILGIASLRLNEHGFQPVDTLDEQVKVVDNQIDVVTKAFQGLTVSCARCHDHKFDPIGQRDFYALFGVLASTRPAQVAIDTPDLLTRHREQLAALKEQIRDQLASAWLASVPAIAARFRGEATDDREVAELEQRAKELQAKLAGLEAAGRAAALSARGSGAPANLPAPQARWSFDRDARDSVGELHGELLGAASIRNGRLVLDGREAHLRSAPLKADLRERTLEAWVALANLEQQGGGVMTVETSNGAFFDSIVFAEKEPKKWVPGSNHFRRSQNLNGIAETAGPGELVHVAVVYRADNSVAFFRNGVPYAPPYTPAGEDSALRTYEAGHARILLGRRHTGGGRAFLAGEIDEARLYHRALSAEEIAQSFAAGVSGVSLDAALAALPSAQREQHADCRAELARVQERLKLIRDKAGGAAEWERALSEAAKNESNPLHALARLRRSSATELARSWSDFIAQQPATSEDRSRDYRLAWDFSAGGDAQWFRQGANLPPRAAHAGEFALEPSGGRVVSAIHPAGVYSHALSQRHGGLFTSPRFQIETDFISVRALGGKGAMVRLIVDNYPLGINSIFPKATLDNDQPGWVKLDTNYRKGSWAYLEFGTHDDLTRPVLARGQSAPADGRSFFGVERVVFHDAKENPRDANPVTAELLQQPAAASFTELAGRYEQLLAAALNAWRTGRVTESQRALLDELTRRNLLPNTLTGLPAVASLVNEYRRLENEIPIARHAPGVIEAAAYDAPFMPRGDHLKPGDPIPRGYLQVLGTKPFFAATAPSLHHSTTPLPSGRLELAHEIASPQNPLTARVMVNRLWHHLFGRGLVPTVDNFGRLGDKPTHPELLDYLAARFVADGWSHQRMIRFLVTSRAFQMGSEPSPRARELDPANEWLSHFRLRRLEAEAIRDSLLAVSGRLDRELFGPPVPLGHPSRRSIYLAIRRNTLSPFLEIFDAPKPFSTHGRRDTTNVPAQSLALLNDPFVIDAARYWARSLTQQTGDANLDQRIQTMFIATLSRPPDDRELAQSRRHLTDLAIHHGIAHDALPTSEQLWQDFAQSLFNLKEFIYLR